MQRCSGVLIGNQLARGISGGQAKRVNIGLALVTSPRVLFLDEPTSGLDSYTSNEVHTIELYVWIIFNFICMSKLPADQILVAWRPMYITCGKPFQNWSSRTGPLTYAGNQASAYRL